MTPLPFIEDNCWFVDHSSLEYIMACHRKAEYHIVHKRKPSDERIALSFGQAVHSGLEAMFAGKDYKPALHTAFDGMEVPPGDHRDLLKATRMLEDYSLGDFLTHDWTVETKDGKPLIELAFALPLGTVQGIRIVWTGRIDLIVRRDSGLFVVDHKTTSVFGSTYYDQFQNSSQPLGYMWAAQKYLGEPFRGYIINVFPVRKGNATTKTEPERQRVFLTDQDLLDEWKINTLSLLDMFLRQASTGYLPKMTNQCTTKFGRCEFFNVCQLPRESRLNYLHSGEFVDVTWSPLNRET